MSEHRKKSVRRRILIAAIALPLLYILSSGPMLSLAYICRSIHSEDDGSGSVGVSVDFDVASWWLLVYSPLWWTAEQSWGDPLSAYWNLFPISLEPAAHVK